MKKKIFFYAEIVIIFLLAVSCASTKGSNVSGKNFELSEPGKFDAFGMIEVTIENYTPEIVNKNYYRNLKLLVCNDSTKKSFYVNTDEDGFFRLENLDKYTSYTIQQAFIKPDSLYTSQEWTFGVWKSFKGSYTELYNIGLIKVYSDYIEKEYEVNIDEKVSIQAFEKKFNEKYKTEVFKGPDSYERVLAYKNRTPQNDIYNFTQDKDMIKLRKSKPDVYIDKMCSLIIEKSVDDFDKVRLIHDAVTNMLDYDKKSFFEGKIPSQDYKSVMKSGLSVCAGYANVFEEFCNRLRVPCEIVSGFAKGYGNARVLKDLSANHAWNIVKVEGDWYLIDCTWDAGGINGNSFIRDYSSAHLFARPEEFIFTHYPSNEKYQLLEYPLSDKDIIAMPYIKMTDFNKYNYGFRYDIESINAEKRQFVFLFYNDKENIKKISVMPNNMRDSVVSEKISDNCYRVIMNFTEDYDYFVDIVSNLITHTMSFLYGE